MGKSALICCAVLTLVLSTGARANDLDDPSVDVALQWNDVAVTAVRNSNMPPSVAARALAIVHAAMYDAWAAYDATAAPSAPGAPARQPLGNVTNLNKASAVSYAAYRTLLDLFPSQTAAIRTFMVSTLFYDPSITSTGQSSAPGVGNAAAAAQLAYRHGDGSNQLGSTPYSDTTGYQPLNTADLVTDPNHWQPLRAPDGTVQTFLTPQWSTVTPFALQSADQFRPSQPPQFGNWQYLQRVRDVLQTKAELDDLSKMSAEYWEDAAGSETPAGHWNRIAEEISNRDKHDLDGDVKMFFALNEALFDASIAVWDAKVSYNGIRPVSAIRYLYNGQAVQGWQPWVATPPYPEFPSEQGAFASAGAEVLKRFTGSDAYAKQVTFAPGSSRYDAGNSPAGTTTLGWFTFSQIAEDAEWSGLSGGIQFDDADLQAGGMGRAVAGVVWDRYSKLLSGVR